MPHASPSTICASHRRFTCSRRVACAVSGGRELTRWLRTRMCYWRERGRGGGGKAREGEGGEERRGGGAGREGRRRAKNGAKRTGKCEGWHGMRHLTRLGRCMAVPCTHRDENEEEDDDDDEAGRLSSSAKQVPRWACCTFVPRRSERLSASLFAALPARR